MTRYKTGSKSDVIRRMAEHAIRDQFALIDAYTPILKLTDTPHENIKIIDDCQRNIHDYRRIVLCLKTK